RPGRVKVRLRVRGGGLAPPAGRASSFHPYLEISFLRYHFPAPPRGAATAVRGLFRAPARLRCRARRHGQARRGSTCKTAPVTARPARGLTTTESIMNAVAKSFSHEGDYKVADIS